jgi:folate-binding protein YgfZ
MGNDLRQYAALTSGTGLVPLSDWTQVEISGAGRLAFLNNFCTNDVRGLTEGTGCEAFLTNAQGHVLSHAWIFCEADSLVVMAPAPPAIEVISHLDRYIMREPVTLHDRSDAAALLLVAGATTHATLGTTTSVQLPTERLQHVRAELAGYDVALRQIDLVGPVGLVVESAADAVAEIAEALVAGGATRCGSASFEQVRIESGTPLYGVDVSVKNLPQEVDRNARAISFSKGCYLGQETVARIASIGHVNRTLTGIRFDGRSIPASGTLLTADGKPVGQVTSSTFSPKLDCPLALAYVRTSHHADGTRVDWSDGQGEVVRLPVTA